MFVAIDPACQRPTVRCRGWSFAAIWVLPANCGHAVGAPHRWARTKVAL